MERTSLAVLAVLVATVSLPAQREPSRRDLDRWCRDFLALDGRTDAGRDAQEQILIELQAAAPLDERDVRTWTGKLQKLWRKGTKLEKSGDNWYWEDEKRGRYIVGGETRRPKGLAITMHGGGVGSGDAGGAAGAYQAALSKLDLLMVAPEVLEKTECGWTDSGTEEFVLQLIDDALRTFKLDPDKVFLVGHSMGGYGSWTLGGHHADRVAAVAPSAGGPTPIREREGGPVVDIIEGVAPSLRNVFVSIYQSIDDPRVPPEPNQFAAKLLGKLAERWGGYEYDYWEVDGRGHGAPPGGHLAHLEKIVDRTRQAIPERIVWQPVLAWKRQFYWLYWQRPTLESLVVADLDRQNNTVAITCEVATKGLYVLLDERMVDLEKEVVVTVNGTETFRGMPTFDLGTLLTTSVHPDPKLQFAARVPAFVRGS